MSKRKSGLPPLKAAVPVLTAVVPILKAAGTALKGVRRAVNTIKKGEKAPKVMAFIAAEASDLFGVRAGKGGGAAFVRWCADNDVDTAVSRTLEEWKPIVEAFANRPVHGHRRTAAGGNHKINRHHRR
jgi:hypothetical protein